MPASHDTQTIIRFGPFVADLQTQELRKHGVRLRLPGQSFLILKMLLEHRDKLVTRDELRATLWPSDTFVDFDNGLNAAVNRLRETLGDSANYPHLIETLPRRGYRFIAPVDTQQGEPQWLPLRPKTRGGQVVPEQPLQRYWVLALSCAALIVSAVLLYWMMRPLLPPKVSGYTRITNDGRAKSFRIDALPVIATDGSRLYFAEAASSGSRFTLNQASASGGETSPVPTPFEQNIELGDISSNRSDLLLQTFVAGESEMPLWILPLGGVPRRVGDVFGRDATWSPNGLMIAYANGHELYVCKADGTETRKLVAAPGQVRWPRWSPRGGVLRFTVGNPGGRTSIEEISVDGGRPHALLPDLKGLPCCGNWTPDGEYYFFQSTSDSGTDIWALRERTGLFRRGTANLCS